MFTVCKVVEYKPILIAYDLQFFAEDANGAEKTEQPTAKKLEDARKEGQVAKSQEVATAFSLLALFVILRFTYGFMGEVFSNTFQYIYNSIPNVARTYDGNLPIAYISSLVIHGMLTLLILCAPFFIVGFTVSLICDIVQVGFKPTTKPLQPKLSKLNPISGMKKIISTRKIFELAKSILKLAIMSVVIISFFSKRKESLFLLYDISLKQAIGLMGNLIIDLGLRIAAAYMIIAFSDLIYQRRKFNKDMMMTKQEVKDEFKNSEGNPEIKGAQKRRMMQASQRRMMQNLPKADVVITNPTHYAVAIKYDAEEADAPIVVAKGADYLAQKIKEIARENNVEIVENKPLARMLYANVEVGELVPPELYKAVAEVLAYVYHLKGKV
ncbi:flagellar biosynthetic protein FlhB [Butyrivibrio proteoclasticus]|uniref:Flagellar biosynthetic protein FlhB n=1 Tax=Butyrivibrio proteoclasticus TaxID=43305 RepID=A0A1I5QK55_9FIRM|nr:flagellar biosynthesis protein FlhB [Butyrivibrio proteoclasticus]SFP46266.1 flagellar biosynthetic protein FlhB [Butyrivibrio proteoclasticus]